MENKNYQSSAKTVGTSKWAMDLPIATYGLIALNLAFYIGSMPIDRVILATSNGIIPANPTFASLFQATFLHLDPVHLSMNLIFLWLFGRRVERALGPVMFLGLYIGSGLTASVLHVAIAREFLPAMQNVPVLGASGAIAGVLGMYAILFRNDKTAVGKIAFPTITFLFAWLLFQVVLGLFQVSGTAEALGPFDLKYIGYWSHIGGFVFGMAAAWAIAMRKAPAGPLLSRSGLRRKALIDVAQRFESLTLEDGDDPFGYAELGRVWALMGDQSRSAANYLKAIELYRRDGNRDEALAALHAALKFWPETTLSHAVFFRFICFFEALGEYEEAASRFAWLTSAAHGEPEAEMALLKLGQVQLDRLGRPDLAIEPLNRLLLEFPNSEWADLARQLLGRAGASGE